MSRFLFQLCEHLAKEEEAGCYISFKSTSLRRGSSLSCQCCEHLAEEEEAICFFLLLFFFLFFFFFFFFFFFLALCVPCERRRGWLLFQLCEHIAKQEVVLSAL